MIHRLIAALGTLERAGMWLVTHARAVRKPLVAACGEPEWRVRVAAIEHGEAPAIVADDDLIASTARSFLARGGLRRGEERGQS